jgi:hypothetical protein
METAPVSIFRRAIVSVNASGVRTVQMCGNLYYPREGAMVTSYEDKISEQAQQYLEEGEHVLGAFIANPRGATTVMAGGGAAAGFGGRRMKAQHQAAAEGGLRLASPMALTLTDRRLMVLKVSMPIALGKGGDVKGFVSAVPLSEVDSIEIKRLLVGKVVKVTVGGVEFKLEANATANAKGLVAAFTRAKGASV